MENEKVKIDVKLEGDCESVSLLDPSILKDAVPKGISLGNQGSPFHPTPKKNEPCCKCRKPTRSHVDRRTGAVMCHECWEKIEVPR